MNLSAIKDYIRAARTIARERHTSVAAESMRLARFRLRTGRGTPIYLAYRLFEVSPDRWDDYLDNRERYPLQLQLNAAEYRHLADDKLAFYRHCRERDVPTPEVLAVVGGQARASEGEPRQVARADEMRRFLERLAPRDLVFKVADGTRGAGFRVARWDGQTLHDLASGVTLAPEVLFDQLLATGAMYLVQERLRAHPALAPVMAGDALGTVRIVSFVTRDGDVVLPWSYIRLPVSGSVSDNFAHGESGNLVASVDIDTGTLGVAFGRRRGRTLLERFEAHPETGATIVGYLVPCWEELKQLCVQTARKFPGLRTVGWDIAITPDSLFVIEANKTYDIDGHQVSLQRGLRRELLELYAR